MITIEFELVDQQFRRAIDSLLAASTDLSPLMTTLAGHLAAIPERAFEQQKDPSFGEPWAALSPRYAKRKAQKYGPGKKILEATGEMMASIVPESGEDYAEVVIGSPYAIYHQTGTSRMPARPPLGIDEEGEEDIVQSTLDYLQAAIDGAK